MVNVSPPGGSGEETDSSTQPGGDTDSGDDGTDAVGDGSPDVEEVAREAQRSADRSGIDDGEPIAGVQGQGSPRDDSDSTPVEGDDGVDGLGSGGPDVEDVAEEAADAEPEPRNLEEPPGDSRVGETAREAADSAGGGVEDVQRDAPGPDVAPVADEARQNAQEPASNLDERSADAAAERLGREQELEAVRSEPEPRDLEATPGDSRVGQTARQAADRQGPAEAGAAEQQELRELVAASSGAFSRGDIGLVSRTDDGVQASLTREAELEQARENFNLDRDPDRVFSGTERVPLFFDEDDFRVTRNDEGEITTEVKDASLAEFQRRQAALRDPLRDAEDFVVEDGEVRQRAAPFLEDQREAFADITGVSVGDDIDDRLTTTSGQRDVEESRARLKLQDISESTQQFLKADQLNSGIESPTDIGDRKVEADLSDSALFGFSEDLQDAPAAVFDPAGAALDVATIVEQGADVSQAQAATQRNALKTNEEGDIIIDESFGKPFKTPGTEAREEFLGTKQAAKQAGQGAIQTAQERPGLLVGAAILSAGTAVGGGRAVRGVTRRAAVGRRRLRGDVEIDSGELVNQDTIRAAKGETGGPVHPELDRQLSSDPAEAFRRQADEFTPEQVDETLPGEGSVVKHATQEQFDSDLEVGDIPTDRPTDPNTGLFVGPEASLGRFDFSGAGSLSDIELRLPRTSGRAGEVVTTRVPVRRMPDRVGPEKFTGDETAFLRTQEGTTAAFVRSKSNITPEAEALIPPGARFAETSQRAFTTVGGEVIDIRMFRAAEDVADGAVGASGGAGVGVRAADLPTTRLQPTTTTGVTPAVFPASSPTSAGATRATVGGAPSSNVAEPSVDEQFGTPTDTASETGSSPPASPLTFGTPGSVGSSSGVTAGSGVSTGVGTSTGSAPSVSASRPAPTSPGASTPSVPSPSPAPSTPTPPGFTAGSPTSPTIPPATQATPATPRIDLEFDSTKRKKEPLAIASSEQFEVDFAAPEDVVDTETNLDFGF